MWTCILQQQVEGRRYIRRTSQQTVCARRVASALPAARGVLSAKQVNSQGGRGGSGAVRGRGGRRGAPRPQPYDRNKFLQANFRFLVSDAGDLRRWEADADLMPDWEDVLEVRCMTTIFVVSTSMSPVAYRHEAGGLTKPCEMASKPAGMQDPSSGRVCHTRS